MGGTGYGNTEGQNSEVCKRLTRAEHRQGHHHTYMSSNIGQKDLELVNRAATISR